MASGEGFSGGNASDATNRGEEEGIPCGKCKCLSGVLVCHDVLLKEIPHCDGCDVRVLNISSASVISLVVPAAYRPNLLAMGLVESLVNWDDCRLSELPELTLLYVETVDLSEVASVLQTDDGGLKWPMVHLTSLGLVRCNLRTLEALPAFRRYFPHLRLLNLAENHLEWLPEEYLPAYVTHVDLRGNNIREVTPERYPSLSALSELEALELSGNPVAFLDVSVLPGSLERLMLSGITSMTGFNFGLLEKSRQSTPVELFRERRKKKLWLEMRSTTLRCTCGQARDLLRMDKRLLELSCGGERGVVCVTCLDEALESAFNGYAIGEPVGGCTWSDDGDGQLTTPAPAVPPYDETPAILAMYIVFMSSLAIIGSLSLYIRNQRGKRRAEEAAAEADESEFGESVGIGPAEGFAK